MSVIGELKFFLGLQIKQTNQEIFIHQQKYSKKLILKFKMNDCKSMPTPMDPSIGLSKDK
uniref:Reverse transcriptase Ty1/copia-type domain-containing protein n=1 Tax=Cajanus cajan TaxID=3821 RepID=A0A151SQX7_CAJCA|nr:hypothetical protein KK1_003426 [Cajanus cajan]